MDESILNHLFLPHYLPSSEDKDFLIQDDHRNEYVLLEFMKKYLNSLRSDNATSTLPIFRILSDCIERWSVLQNPQTTSVLNLQTAIEQLSSGYFLPIYFHAQNAAILIEMDGNNIRQPLISSWQVSLPTGEITSSLAPHLSCFPVTTYRLNHRSQLSSKVHCELLMDFMTNTIEYSKSHKASREVDEIRDVPESHYVCQWWIQQFQGIRIEDNRHTFVPLKKKHRDQIRWNNALLPFRRSGLWMTIKVIFQIILTKRLRDVGTVVYKLFITHFLTYILDTRKCSTDFQISTDLLVHCIKKIVRRLNKIETKWSSIDLSDINEWVQHTKQDIQWKINQLLPKSDWQKTIRIDEIKNQNVLVYSLELDDIETYQHSCSKLRKYLDDLNSSKISGFGPGAQNYNSCTHVNQVNYIPFIEELMETFNYTVGVTLTRIEIWVGLSLEQWINRSSPYTNGENHFAVLQRFYENYQNAALNHYYSKEGPNDSIGYSRFIITALTILRLMHENLCNDSRFKPLKDHSIDIPNLMMLFEFLVLPNREDMIRARDLYDYFCRFNVISYPDLLTGIESTDAFGVYFANQTWNMKESIQQIRAQAERDRQQKIQEVNDAKRRYKQLMDSVSHSSCSCEYKYRHRITCHKCQVQNSADSIKVKIFECPIPSTDEGALAVIFELQMPIEIRCYRDILWQFINRPNPNPNHNMYEWLSVPPHSSKLGPYFTGPSSPKIRLISSTKSTTQSHYSTPSIASASVESFLFENSLKVQISPTQPIEFENECRILTPQLEQSDYKPLQFSLHSTEFIQNQVIAKLSDCSQRLKPTQFVEFGSFRSGHRLQWWNLLTILEMDSLSIAEESVAILIIHSILQYGPLPTDSEIRSAHWCTESHRQLFEDHFVDQFISRLNHHLDDCELNWQNELVLVVITMITMRILTICTPTRKDNVADLAIKCRRTGEKWIELILKGIGTISPSDLTELQNLRLKVVHVGVSCLLTFSTHQDRINCLLSSDEHVISLLKAATTVHDNIILNKGQSNLSIFMRNIMRLSERVLVMVQPTIAEYLQRTSYQSLNEFASIYWAVIKSEGGMNGQWKKRKVDMYDGWYDCQYQSRHISLDCIRGTFLVDDMTIGFLPEKITSNELFICVFGSHIFEVQAAKLPNTYITKYLFHGAGRVHYEFYFNDQNKCLIITERHIQTKEIFQLIPHSCFQTELPDAFVSNHSHWWNAKQQTVEFRPVRFQESDFLDNKPYVLLLTIGCVFTSETINRQMLINQSSTFFENLFARYFHRLDDKPYVYMMRDNTCHTHTIINIHLSRLKIAFRYNAVDHTITSREYSDMCIDENQWLGTLTGLKSGLVLSPSHVNGQRLEQYPYRKLIVPFGEVHSARSSCTDHQIVTVNRSSFLHQYFVFIMNDRLKILQSTDSPTGWLYLTLLHAMTSHPLPDQYTGMTGMERAFQLLNSAGCWSDQPYDALSLNILGQIAAISPRVNYYPDNLACMVKIDWNDNGLPHSLQHFGYYLIANKLIENSQQLNFMYSSSTSCEVPEIFDGKLYNKTLLKKLYWDYRDSYNPMACLSAEIEADILSALNEKPYQSTPEHCLHNTTNYNVVRLVNGLYASGNVYLRDFSQQHWLPLSQWFATANHLKTIWIGLLKMTDSIKTSTTGNSREQSDRFECLLNFLHYISDKLKINPFYLQMLKTVLKVPDISMKSITFPPFIRYADIEQTSVIEEELVFETILTARQRTRAIEEIKECFERNRKYENYENLTESDTDDRSNVNALLKKWQSNRKLRSFLQTVQRSICSVAIEQFHMKVTYYPQQFVVESIKDHHRIQCNSLEKLINRKLLQNAEQKFHHPYSGHFDKPTVTHQTTNRQNQFPNQIFTSIENQDNPTSKIGHYFKNQLDQSWKKLLLDKQIQKEDPSMDELNECLNSLRNETAQSWNELVRSTTDSNEQLFQAGLVLRITPTTLIPLLQQTGVTLDLTPDQRKLLGGILVCWTLEQQLERALHFAIHGKWEDFKKEISNTPHSNWKPCDYIPWLILELEMNITIREIQIRVAHHMMQLNTTPDDSTVRSIVMQMNMGEGKTSVILPMLAVSLCESSSSLVRIIVLKSLFPTNYQSLRYKLGGILNRRIFPFACRRDMNFNGRQISQIYGRLKQGLRNCDVVLISPEDILSFDLLTIDKCRRNEFNTGRSMLLTQRWLKKYARDVLDESDEILHVKYQLIYTVGGQQQVDAGAERWKTIQSIIELIKRHAADISNRFSEDVCYKPSERRSAFPQFRLQSHKPFPQLCETIAHDWIQTRNYRLTDRQIILPFILQINSSVEHVVNQFPQNDVQIFLIIRGLLSSEVLLVALKKRYRVNYGVNPNLSFNRLLAVPFRAKDVVADRTEFGHPDVALVLTHFCYYYSGLNNEQLTRCFDRLADQETDPASVYDQWIVYEDANDIPTSIKQWKGVNIKDYQQRTKYLFPTFRNNMLVVNYFLNHFVFPREAKQFPHKLVSSAWDLSSSARSKIITGFSGTNDTQMLLPVHIRQYDLLELQKTDAIVVNNLLQPENERYQPLPINATSDEILNRIVGYNDSINVILDVGALFIDGTNKDIAVKWLNLSDKTKIDYAIYFNSDTIVVCDRQYHHHRFETSPASERLDHCVFYLDEIHTRGTDFKFPKGFRAAVTLGNGLTKDRFVQACMRMRKLGNGHSLTFWSSHEVHQQIAGLKKNASRQNREQNDSIGLIDILRWVYENTVQSTWDGLHHWAAQSLSFQRKVAAFRNIQWNDQQQVFTDTMMKNLAQECLEPEIIELVRMYGAPKVLQTVFEIHSARYQSITYHLSTDIRDAVLKKLYDYGGTKQRLSQLLDEEQQRELEQELEEERQLERPPPVAPCEPILHEEIKRLSDIDNKIMNLSNCPSVFQPLPYAFTDTTFYPDCQPNSWEKNLWISTEFQRVILTKGESLNPFLRPPRWIIVYRNQHIIFVSAFEANWLIGRLTSNKSSITTLRLLLPRIKRIQSIFVNTPTLTVPLSIAPLTEATAYFIPIEWLVQLFIFNGTLYFGTIDEQTAYCQCLALCPKPRTVAEEKAFEEGWIAVDGFVSDPRHRRSLKIDQARFNSNPLTLVKQLIENRNNSHAPTMSHVGNRSVINGDLNANPVNMHPQFIGDYPQPKVTTSKIPDLPPSIQAATESPGLNRPPRSPGPVLGPFVQFISTDLEKMLWMGIVLIFLHVSFDQPHIEFICDVKVGYKWKTLYENIFDMRAYCINLFVELGSGEGDDEIAWKIDWGDNQTNDSFLIARCESYSFRKKRLAVSGAPEGCRRVSSR